MENRYSREINLLRVFSCLAVLAYHLNFLKGGFLAVCIFFVLSGYLSCLSAFRKEKFSILAYYKNRLVKLYIPLILVVFVTLFVFSFFDSGTWLMLKNETTSVLLGVNNFFQINANLDYFARHISSPFMHFWYISILLQVELIFPFIYLFFKKLGTSCHKIIPCLDTFILAIIFTIYFFLSSNNSNLMLSYYGTLSRIFSYLFGLFLGFTHHYYGPLILKFFKNKILKYFCFYLYFIILIFLTIYLDSSSSYFAYGMIGTTLLTCRMLDYAFLMEKKKLSWLGQILKVLGKMSYSIYLVQYPVIFFVDMLSLTFIRIPLILVLIFIFSSLLYFILYDFKKKNFFYFLKVFLLVITICTAGYGAFYYITAEDHTEEMKQLEEQLSQNEKLLAKKQKEYKRKSEQEEKEWLATLESFENEEEKITEQVRNLSLIGVGDSVMLGAIENLYEEFPNGYFDAKISRTAWVVNGILKDLETKNLWGEAILLNVGANGDCSSECKTEIMKTCGSKEVFWVNTVNDQDVHVNASLSALSQKYSNLHIIDWATKSKNHPEYFVADGIHLTTLGKEAYTKTIYEAIYDTYLKAYQLKKEEQYKQHEEVLQKEIRFYGNDFLLNAYQELQQDFQENNISIETLSQKELEEKLSEETDFKGKRVFIYYNKTKEENISYLNLPIEDKDRNYVVLLDDKLKNDLSSQKNIQILDFTTILKENPNYWMADHLHLTKKGNQAFSTFLKENILQEE